MAFNRSRSVEEGEEAEVVGDLPDTVSFVLLFVFLLYFFLVFFCRFLLSSLDFRTLVTFIGGDASAPVSGFLLLRLAPVAKEGTKMVVMGFLWWSSPGQSVSVA